MTVSLSSATPQRLAAALSDLASVVEPDAPGWTRRALTDEAAAGRAVVEHQMREAGLDCRVDAAGNLVGVLPGEGTGPAIVTGSHTDTVPGGGRFDGIVGVVGAIEAVRLLKESDRKLRHDLLVVDFYGEEANPWGLSCLGSRALVGNLTSAHLDRTDEHGVRLGDAMRRAAIDPHGALSSPWRPGDLKAFVELHIEQGPLLEQADCCVGIVSAIASIARAELTFHGRRDHAGTMPIALRHDAACAAAEAVLAVERLGQDGGVALAGQMTVHPGAANVVPDLVRLTVEFRSVDLVWMQDRRSSFEHATREAAARRGVDVTIEWISGEPLVTMNEGPMRAIDSAAGSLGHPTMLLPSGAGHDTVQIGHLTDVGMIFVPSRGGRSHCPEEFTETEDIARGVHVLAQTLVELDRS